MHRAQLAIGITLIIIGTILLLNRMEEEASYQQCLKDMGQQRFTMESSFIQSCQYPQFQNDPFLISIYIVTMSVGIWLLVCGLKSISILAWARESLFR